MGSMSNLFSVDRLEYFHDEVQSIEQPLTDAELGELVTK